MRAIVVDDPGPASKLRWTEVPDPVLGPGEVLVEVHATALNRADLSQRAGRYPPPPGASEVLGLEMAGRVAALGEGVEGWSVGERVCALLPGGGYAELAAVPASMLMRVPERLSMAEAGGLPEVFLTAFSALFREGRAQPGEVVLIHAGASGVGTAAIQMASRAGCRVLTTVGGPAKAAACRELGAELAINRFLQDFEEAVRDHLGTRDARSGAGSTDLRAPGGVDLIVDMVGKDYFERNLRLLNVLGRLVFVSAQSGADVALKINALSAKRLSLVGATLRARSVAEKSELSRAFLERFGEDLAEGRIRPIIDSTFPIQRAEEAHAFMAANKNIGKIVLVVKE